MLVRSGVCTMERIRKRVESERIIENTSIVEPLTRMWAMGLSVHFHR